MLQYLDSSHTALTHGTLQWQHMAPTAPDTMACSSWCVALNAVLELVSR
jgi:hypothetical protein